MIVSPATTARIVANAIADTSPSISSPPSAYASSGAALFWLADVIVPGGSNAAAP